jgi:hypothetical protein
VDVDCNKVVVDEPRIGGGDAGELGGLTGGKAFVGIEAGGAGE